ncbi:MAG: hypothetical protein J6M43_04055 [Neisseriaceae bacterium]|nr:hypothetical protein [Neisseriaceae bacterium]
MGRNNEVCGDDMGFCVEKADFVMAYGSRFGQYFSGCLKPISSLRAGVGVSGLPLTAYTIARLTQSIVATSARRGNLLKQFLNERKRVQKLF